MDLNYTISDTLTPAIARALAAAEDFTPAMAKIADQMETDTAFRFDDEKDPDGVPWLPSQRAIRTGLKTLDDTSHLERSFEAHFDALSASLETNVPYAATHHFGDKRTIQIGAHSRTIKSAFGKSLPAPTTVEVGAYSLKRNMPARGFIGFGDDNIQAIEEILSNHLRDAFEGRPA